MTSSCATAISGRSDSGPRGIADSVLDELPAGIAGRRLYAAVSGGLDSTVLLQLLHRVGASDLTVVHVDHGLHPQSASWADHVRALCDKLQLPCQVLRVDVTDTGQGVEAAARAARYRAFVEMLPADGVLVLAHHRDDQIETVLLRALGAAAPEMCAGMPERRTLGKGLLWRPLLGVSRAQIRAFAEQSGLRWLEDPSNRELRFARNRIRHHVLPALEQASPGTGNRVLRLVQAAQTLQPLYRKIATHDLAEARVQPDALSLKVLSALSPARRENLVRAWLNLRRHRGLPEQIDMLLDAARDAQPVARIARWELRRYRDSLWRMPTLAPPPAGTRHWTGGEPLVLPGLGALSVEPALHYTLEVRWPQGGERIRLPGRAHSQALKKLWQVAGVPPWVRARTPLVYRQDELIAVGGRWISREFADSYGNGDVPRFVWRHELAGDPP